MSRSEPRHELIEHTGDMAFLVTAPDLASLYDASTRALFDVILDVETIQAKESVAVEVTDAADPEDLFVRFLSELLFLHDARDWLFCGFRPEVLADDRVVGAARGERFDPARHAVLRQVKAITYHHLLLEQASDGWTARVVLDL